MIPQTFPRLVRSFVSLAFASLAPWRETLFWRSWQLPGFLSLTAKAQRTQREIAMQATRNSWLIARNQNRTVFLSEQLLMIYRLPSLFFSASLWLALAVFGWIAA